MGYEVSRRRVYGPQDRYCNGSGCSVLVDTLEQAESQYESFAKNDAGYPVAVFITDGSGVVKQSGPSVAEVDRAMQAAYRRRQQAS
jgi:hypothetical protein